MWLRPSFRYGRKSNPVSAFHLRSTAVTEAAQACPSASGRTRNVLQLISLSCLNRPHHSRTVVVHQLQFVGGLCWTVFARNSDTAVPAEENGDLQTLICVLVARPRRCPTLSNPVPWQNWMAAYLSYTLQMKTLFRGWPVMVYDIHTRRRSL